MDLTETTSPEQKEGMSNTATVKRPRRTKAEQRAESLEQILDAAEYLFSKRGLDGVTLRDVAERVGIHTTLLHYYFKDKTQPVRGGLRAPRADHQRPPHGGLGTVRGGVLATSRPSRVRYTRSWTPTSTSTTTAATAG